MDTESSKSQIVEENDCFFFESDHLALKGNKDYSELLKTLFVLESQRQRLLKDYEEVAKLKKQALEEPLSVVEKLKNGETLNVPDSIRIAEVPTINWTKYKVKIPEKFIKEIENDKSEGIEQNEDLFRDQNKITKSKSWTTEEQKRLEELLVVYPPEDIELRRFKKIAQALGNRTVQQVCSRVQKYFIKLYKAGLPIPGRIPKSVDRKKTHKHQRHNHYLIKPSTFFPQLNIPVVMDEQDDSPGPSQSSQMPSSVNNTYSSNYLLPNIYTDENPASRLKSDTEIQLNIIKRVKEEKLKNEDENFQHVGYKCDYCNEEPIIGSRWHCTTCINNSIDFCNDCIIAQMYSDYVHPLAHNFVIARNNKTNSCESIYSDSSQDSDMEKMENSSCDDDSGSEDDFKSETNETCAGGDVKEENMNGSYSNGEPEAFKMEVAEFIDGIKPETLYNNEENGTVKLNSSYDEIFTHSQNFSDFLNSNLLFDE